VGRAKEDERLIDAAVQSGGRRWSICSEAGGRSWTSLSIIRIDVVVGVGVGVGELLEEWPTRASVWKDLGGQRQVGVVVKLVHDGCFA